MAGSAFPVLYRRILVASLIGVTASTLSVPGPTTDRLVPAAASDHWVASWAGSPTVGGSVPGRSCPSGTGLQNQTVRNIVFSSVGGSEVRVRLTNTFGAQPLQVGRVAVAVAATGASTVAGSMHVLSFSGAPGITIPAGAEAFSDPVAMSVRAQQKLAVSIFLPAATGAATQHFFAMQTNYVSISGKWVFTSSSEPFTIPISCSLFVDGVDVKASAQVEGTLVALGDSITDGAKSSIGANKRWPNDLARRLNALSGTRLSVVDAGISGNEVLLDRQPGLFGQSALVRLDRDVLNQTAATHVILLEGINDIGAANATAAQLIDANKSIITRVHARGMRIFGGTLTAFGGSNPTYGGNYGTSAGEAQREAFNQWVRTGGAFDGVIDFDSAVADPTDPHRLYPPYDSGDHLHPNDAGYNAMADAIDLSMLM
jgi:lysophospholipase L1-like esterase